MKFRAIELNKLDIETIESIRVWRNQDFVRKNMFQPHLITEEEHLKYIEKMKNSTDRGLFVCYLDENPFGVYQYELNKKDNSIVNGCYLINEDYQALGYGTILYFMIGRISREYFNVEKLYAEVIDINKDALALQKKFGNVLEEVLENKVEIMGEKHNVYRYSTGNTNGEKRKKINKLVYQLIENECIEDMVVH